MAEKGLRKFSYFEKVIRAQFLNVPIVISKSDIDTVVRQIYSNNKKTHKWLSFRARRPGDRYWLYLRKKVSNTRWLEYQEEHKLIRVRSSDIANVAEFIRNTGAIYVSDNSSHRHIRSGSESPSRTHG